MAKAWGRRCDFGCESWPDHDDYATCPACGEETTRYSNLKPLDADVARSLKLELDFESYYEEHCKQLGMPVEDQV